MKIACRGGHNEQAQGANSILNEVSEDRKINASVIKFLKLDKNEVLDVTPCNCISAIDLTYGVNKANTAKVSLFNSNHLNAGGGHGVEVLYFGNSATGKTYATRVCNNIAKLGFTNRGAKADIRGLYELKNTDMAAIIVESFFLDSESDVALYKKVGVDAIGKAIAEGIVGHTITVPVPVKVVVPVVKPIVTGQLYKIQAGAYKSKSEADKAVAELKKKGVDSFAKLV